MKQYSYYDAYHRQRKFPMTIRLHRWRSKRGVFLLSFFIALVLVRFFLWEEITEVAGWSRICLERLDANISDSRNFFWYVVIRRSELLLLLTLCGLTRMRKALYYIASGLGGIWLGIFLMSFLKIYGWKGLLLGAAALLPQWIVYGMLFAYLYWLFIRRKELESRESLPRYLLYVLGLFGMMASGIYLECFVNPLAIIPKISLYCKKMSGKYRKSVFLRVHMYLYNVQIVRVYMKTIYKDR